MTTFILLDGRAKHGLVDRATVMDTADTEEEARQAGQTDWADYDAIWQELPSGKLRWDLPPAGDHPPWGPPD